MGSRRLTGIATMAALCLVLVVMAWWGIAKATAPFPTHDSSGTKCSRAETTTKRYARPDDVTVSVYNASKRNGFATLTLQRLESRGFHAGAVGNAPKSLLSSPVKKVRVLTTTPDSTYAELVARNLGKDVPIEVVPDTLGPGINVVVGKKMQDLNPKVTTKLKLPNPKTSCVKVD